MEMNSKRNIALIIGVCLVLLTILTYINFKTRVDVPSNYILIDGPKPVSINLKEVEKYIISGQVTNMKGEIKEITGNGCSLFDIIEDYSGTDFTEVTVISDDEYSAKLTKEEVVDTDKAVLLFDETSVRLYVFGDSNSKRNVSNVKRIIIN